MSNRNISVYAPVALQDSLIFEFTEHFTNLGWVTSDGRLGDGFPAIIEEELVNKPTGLLLQSLQGESTMPYDFIMTIANLQLSRYWVPLIGQYYASGKQIYDINDVLQHMFLKTSVKNATLRDLNMPYDAFYIHFGKVDDISLDYGDEYGNTKECLAGAFVSRVLQECGGYTLRIGIRTILNNSNVLREANGNFVDLNPEEQKLPCAEAIEKSLKRKIDELEKLKDGESDNIILALINERISVAKENMDMFSQSMDLIINALFYLEDPKNNVEETVGRDTSPKIESHWKSAHASGQLKRIRAVNKKLTQNGFRTVYMVGNDVQKSVFSSGKGGLKNTHWRTGHWRDQPFGEKRSKVRRVWIRPTLINKSKGDTPDGHVYVPTTDTLQ